MQRVSAAELPYRPGPPDRFTGDVRLGQPGFSGAEVRVLRVAFAAGARTFWHGHPTGQYLYVLNGRGLVAQAGGPVEELWPGDVIFSPPGAVHWHGAAPDSPMEHLAVVPLPEGARDTDWLDEVSEQEYRQGSHP